MDTGYEDVWRESTPHVLAALVRRYGDFAAAEDAFQEALLAAARQWPADGTPDNPRGWLIRVASRRLVDSRRSDRSRTEREAVVVDRLPADELVSRAADSVDPNEGDDSLALLVLCCHPALSRPSQVALTLRAVAGLGTDRIARAFLVPESTMAQRISRAKARLRQVDEPFGVPPAAELPERVASVAHVLYLIFTEGHTATVGAGLTDVSLAREAIRLTRRLHDRLPGESEVTGLLALMLLTDSRRVARTDAEGSLVPLSEQDRSRWDRAMIEEGLALVEAALPSGPVGPYQLQAAISAVHAEAAAARGHRLGSDRDPLRDAGRPDAEPGCQPQPRRGGGRDPRPRGRAGDARPAARRARAATPSPRTRSARPPARAGRADRGGAHGVRPGRDAGDECPRAAIPSGQSSGDRRASR